MGGYAWSDEETAILERIYHGETTLIESAHLLPNRTINAIRNRVCELGMEPRRSKSRSKFRWVETSVIAALREYGPLNCHQLASITTASHDRIRQIFYYGHGTRFHVVDWCRLYEKGSYTPVWAIGAGEDAPKPVRKTRAEKYRRDKIRGKAQRGTLNPFATAAGLVQAPGKIAQGRVFKQDMTGESLEDRRAA